MKITGITDPLPEMVADFVAKRLRPILLGQDPVAHEKLWDQMHRIVVHGRRVTRCWQSARSTALWGLKGRWLN
jgi:L-alanine-DL-glutamate epimerase-like enolase superfamily enzyme